jgi:alkylhydroperoxidase family enzyme
MAWVEIAPEGRDYDHVLASHSLNPEALAAHLELYRVVMFGPSGLSRTEREAVAVAVSAANDCHY